MVSPDIRGFGRPIHPDRDTREMMAARTANAPVIRPSVPGLKTLKFQDALESPACQPPADWTSIPQDERLDSPAEHEIAQVLDDGGSVSEAEIPVRHQRALDVTHLFREKRIVDPKDPKGIKKITSEVATVRPSSHTDRANTLGLEPRNRLLLPRHLGAHKGEIHKKRASGARIFVKPHQQRPELPSMIHVDRKIDEGGIVLGTGGKVLYREDYAAGEATPGSPLSAVNSVTVWISDGFKDEGVAPEKDGVDYDPLWTDQSLDTTGASAIAGGGLTQEEQALQEDESFDYPFTRADQQA